MLNKTRLLLCSLLLAHNVMAQPAPAGNTDLPLDELRLFSEVFHQIRENYVSEVSDRQLLEYAIEGMLDNLDPHSAYLNREDFLALQENTSGEFGGVGLEVTMENGLLRIITPIDDTPAQRAGILAGDVIVRIDKKALKGLSLGESIDLMRGPAGSDITLTLLREGQKKPLEITLKRAVIRIDSVKSRIIAEHYGYLRIAQFQNATAIDADKQIRQMLKASNDDLRGLVLDLRNNPGGVMTAAVDLADLFLTEGLIVYTEGRSDDSREEFFATASSLLPDKPIVVLINSGSASASEIVAGALQDRRRALIVGVRSFGKGSVQTILPLPEERAIKLTTARYFTPMGRSIQAEGIVPDIIAQSATLTPDDITEDFREANLAGHIDNNRATGKDQPPADEVAADDYPLHEAINLLRAMQFGMGQSD